MVLCRRAARAAALLGVLAACSVTAGHAQGGAEAVDGAVPAAASIRAQDLHGDLTFLASDLLEGRLAGTTGNRLASAFIGARFDRLGLAPADGDSYFQGFRLQQAELGDANAFDASVAGTPVRGTLGQDFYPQQFSPSGRAGGPLVFVGFGISAPARHYDDYRGADLQGRIALVLDHAPRERAPNPSLAGLVTSEAATPLRKALAAQAHGAAGVVFVGDVQNHQRGSFGGEAARAWPSVPPRVAPYLLAGEAERLRIPAVRISPGLAATLLEGLDQSFDRIARTADDPDWGGPVAIEGTRVNLSASVGRRTFPERNVVAALEGRDPRLRDEWVILGAHLDHEGRQGPEIFEGADDNASGIAGLLEIAEAYSIAAASGRRPRRSVLFAAWNAEERGLLGAWAYVEHPLVPLERTVAVINMDMIGRDEEVPPGGGFRFAGLDPQTAESNRNAVNLLGYSWSPDLSEIVTRANAPVGLDVKRRYDAHPTLLRRSDQWPFLQRGVPAVWFFTGLHPDYHTPADRPDRIDYAKLARVARLVYRTSWAIAEQDGRPVLVRPTG